MFENNTKLIIIFFKIFYAYTGYKYSKILRRKLQTLTHITIIYLEIRAKA